jgi:hypothetical protein
MRRVLRKSIPFVQAALIGTLAAAAVAGVAMLISIPERYITPADGAALERDRFRLNRLAL